MDQEFVLNHPSGLRISRELLEAAFIDSTAGRNARVLDMRTGWKWYQLPVLSDGDMTVGISLGFESGRLRQVTLGDASTELGSSWDDWSEAKEQLKADRIRDWLAVMGLAPGIYHWGEVWAGFDPKGGFGGATIRYYTR